MHTCYVLSLTYSPSQEMASTPPPTPNCEEDEESEREADWSEQQDAAEDENDTFEFSQSDTDDPVYCFQGETPPAKSSLCPQCKTLIPKHNKARHIRNCTASRQGPTPNSQGQAPIPQNQQQPQRNTYPKLASLAMQGTELQRFTEKAPRTLRLSLTPGRFTPDPLVPCPNYRCSSRTSQSTKTTAFTIHSGRAVKVAYLGGVCEVTCPHVYCCNCSSEWGLFSEDLGCQLLKQMPGMKVTEPMFKVGGSYYSQELLISAYTRWVNGDSIAAISRQAADPKCARTWTKVLLILSDVIGVPGSKPKRGLLPFDSTEAERVATEGSKVIRMDWTYGVGALTFYNPKRRRADPNGYQKKFRCSIGVMIGTTCNVVHALQILPPESGVNDMLTKLPHPELVCVVMIDHYDMHAKQIARWFHSNTPPDSTPPDVCEDLFHVVRRLACHVKGHPDAPAYRKDLQQIGDILYCEIHVTKEQVMAELCRHMGGMLVKYSRAPAPTPQTAHNVPLSVLAKLGEERPSQATIVEVVEGVTPTSRQWEPILQKGTQLREKFMQYAFPGEKAPEKHSRRVTSTQEPPSVLAMDTTAKMYGKIHHLVPNNSDHLATIRKHKFGTNYVEAANGVLKAQFRSCHNHGVSTFDAKLKNSVAMIESIGNPGRIENYVRKTFDTYDRGQLMALLANPYPNNMSEDDPAHPEFETRMTPQRFAELQAIEFLEPLNRPAEKADILKAVATVAQRYEAQGLNVEDSDAIFDEVARDLDVKAEHVHDVCLEQLLEVLKLSSEAPNPEPARAVVGSVGDATAEEGRNASRKRMRDDAFKIAQMRDALIQELSLPTRKNSQHLHVGDWVKITVQDVDGNLSTAVGAIQKRHPILINYVALRSNSEEPMKVFRFLNYMEGPPRVTVTVRNQLNRVEELDPKFTIVGLELLYPKVHLTEAQRRALENKKISEAVLIPPQLQLLWPAEFNLSAQLNEFDSAARRVKPRTE